MKRFFLILLSVALILSLTCATAFAAPAPTVQNRKLVQMVERANRQIDNAVAKAQRTAFDDVEWLLDKVDRIVAPVFEYANSIGITVVCEYETYFIDGRYVEVDPLRVVD